MMDKKDQQPKQEKLHLKFLLNDEPAYNYLLKEIYKVTQIIGQVEEITVFVKTVKDVESVLKEQAAELGVKLNLIYDARNPKSFTVNKFSIISYGDESVGMYPVTVEIEGPFHFDSEYWLERFKVSLKDLFQQVMDDDIVVYTDEDLRQMYEEDDDMRSTVDLKD